MKIKHSMFDKIIACCIVLVLFLCSGCSNTSNSKQIANNTTTSIDVTETSQSTSLDMTEVSNTDDMTFDFTWNPKVWSSLLTDIYGDTAQENYYALVDAMMKGDSSCVCTSEEDSWYFTDFIKICCPILEGMIDLFESQYQSDGTFQIVYTVDNATREQMFDEFAKEVENMIKICVKDGDTQAQKALLIHQYFASVMTYDYENSMEGYEPYRAILEKQGICQTFAGAEAHLYMELGIPAVPVGSLSNDETQAHEWVMAKVNDQFYYMDPTFEIRNSGVRYFGMTQAQRDLDDYNQEFSSIGIINYNAPENFVLDDTTYSMLWNASEIVNIERKDGKLALDLIDFDGQKYTVEIE